MSIPQPPVPRSFTDHSKESSPPHPASQPRRSRTDVNDKLTKIDDRREVTWPSTDNRVVEQPNPARRWWTRLSKSRNMREPRKRALVIGINYYPWDPHIPAPRPRGPPKRQAAIRFGNRVMNLLRTGVWAKIPPLQQLAGCVGDALAVHQFLIQHYGFNERDITLLIDEGYNPDRSTEERMPPFSAPTRRNIIGQMRALVRNVRKDDILVFYYAGHGSQRPAQDDDEEDGQNEIIFPCDYERSGYIVDDYMNAIMLQRLPEGVRFTAIIDACHGATMLDLPYTHTCKGLVVHRDRQLSALKKMKRSFSERRYWRSLVQLRKYLWRSIKAKRQEKAMKVAREQRSTRADVICLSGTKDNQTASDLNDMTHAFIETLQKKPDITYQELLQDINTILSSNEFQMSPVITSSTELSIGNKFEL